MKKLGVAVIGLGVGEQHAAAFARHSDCEIRWLYDIDQEKCDDVMSRIQQGKTASSFEQCIEDDGVDIVSIASYDESHYDEIMRGFQAGKHLFVEKPLCQTIGQLNDIAAEWKRHEGKLKLFSNVILRAAPVYQWVKSQFDAGAFGDLFSFEGDYLYGRFNKLTNSWRGEDPHYSVMEGGGVHIIDLMLWLTNDRPQSVQSFGNRICTNRWQESEHKKIPFAGNDFISSLFTYSSGLVSKVTANFGCVHPHQHVIKMYGTKASFLYDDMGARMHWGRDNEPNVQLLKMPTLPLHKGDLIPGFVRAVKEDLDWSKPTQDIFDAISLCAASEQSVKENRKIEVEYI